MTNTQTRPTDDSQDPVVALFEIGDCHVTRSVFEDVPHEVIEDLIYRHISGEWPDTKLEDSIANFEAIINGSRVFTVHHTPFGTMWVITEADRSITTVLRPSEY